MRAGRHDGPAWGYTRATAFRTGLVQLGARHLVTRPYRPQTNGKAERFIKTLLAEWAYVRLYLSNPARLQTLPAWVAAYQHRPHTALDGSPPMRVAGGITASATVRQPLRGSPAGRQSPAYAESGTTRHSRAPGAVGSPSGGWSL